MRIEIIVFEGFDELDVFGPFEVLSTPGIDVELVTVGLPGTVTSQRGLRLDVRARPGSPDGIVVPGGGWLNRAPEGAWAQAERGDLARVLRAQADRTDWLASVCSGAMLLATAGLLEGREATTNRNVFADLEPYVAAVLDERIVDAGDRITAGGLTAGLDLGLALIERLQGTAAADRRSAQLEYERQGRVWRSPPPSAPAARGPGR